MLREQLVEGDYLAFQSRAVRRFGPAAGIFCRHLLFWDSKGHDREGFVYKSEAEWVSETGLVRNQQRQARRKLREAGVLEEERRPGLPPRNFYRLKLPALADALYGTPPKAPSIEADGRLGREADGGPDIQRVPQRDNAEGPTETQTEDKTLSPKPQKFSAPEPTDRPGKSSFSISDNAELPEMVAAVRRILRRDPSTPPDELSFVLSRSWNEGAVERQLPDILEILEKESTA